MLSPSGICILSTHGEEAAETLGLSVVQEDLQRCGISDTTRDPNLKGVTPDGYYRAVYQSKRYTISTWSKVMPVIGYVPSGLNLQDIVVLARNGG